MTLKPGVKRLFPYVEPEVSILSCGIMVTDCSSTATHFTYFDSFSAYGEVTFYFCKEHYDQLDFSVVADTFIHSKHGKL